jgi:hypothetical protein
MAESAGNQARTLMTSIHTVTTVGIRALAIIAVHITYGNWHLFATHVKLGAQTALLLREWGSQYPSTTPTKHVSPCGRQYENPFAEPQHSNFTPFGPIGHAATWDAVHTGLLPPPLPPPPGMD